MKTDGSQSLDLQRDALRAAGVDAVNLYHDFASGLRDDRPGLDSCLRALREGDVLVVWKLDRLGRNLAHLVNTVQDLSARGVGLRVLAGDGAQIDTTTAAGRLVFGIFAALAEFERELIRERTVAGLKAARARGRKGGRKFALTKAQVRLAQAAMAHRDTSVSALCRELGIRPVTLYRYVGPQGELREQGQKVLASWKPEDRDAGRAKRSISPPPANNPNLANWTRGDRKARFEQTAERHAGLSQFAAPFLSRMKFVDEQGEGVSPTLSALRVYREHRAAGRRGLPPNAPLDFAPAALQPLIRRNGVTDRPRRWESALSSRSATRSRPVTSPSTVRRTSASSRRSSCQAGGGRSAKRSGHAPDSPSSPTRRSSS